MSIKTQMALRQLHSDLMDAVQHYSAVATVEGVTTHRMLYASALMVLATEGLLQDGAEKSYYTNEKLEAALKQLLWAKQALAEERKRKVPQST